MPLLTSLPNEEEEEMAWEKVGQVDVDAGVVMIGDPCYTQGEDGADHVKTWAEFLERTWPDTFGSNAVENARMNDTVNALGQPGLGVVVSSGYGDGSYPVYVEREDGRIRAAKVVFF